MDLYDNLNEKNHQFLEEDLASIIHKLQKTMSNNGPVFLWKLVGHDTFKIPIKLLRINQNPKTFEISYEKKDEAYLGKFLSGVDEGLFFIPGGIYIFRTKLVSKKKEGKVVFELPRKISIVERRKFMRVKVDEKDSIKVKYINTLKMENDVIKKQYVKYVYDISVGGLSFLISPSEKKFYEKNTSLEDLEIEINDKLVGVEADIVEIIEVKPNATNRLIYPSYKIGLNFKDMDFVAKDEIMYYVLNHVSSD